MMLVLIWMDYREARQKARQTEKLDGNREFLLIRRSCHRSLLSSFIHSFILLEFLD